MLEQKSGKVRDLSVRSFLLYFGSKLYSLRRLRVVTLNTRDHNDGDECFNLRY